MILLFILHNYYYFHSSKVYLLQAQAKGLFFIISRALLSFKQFFVITKFNLFVTANLHLVCIFAFTKLTLKIISILTNARCSNILRCIAGKATVRIIL